MLPHLPRLHGLKIIADRLHMEAVVHVRNILKDIHAPDLRYITLELPIDIPETAAQFCGQLFKQNTRDVFSVLDRAIISVEPSLFVVTVDIQGHHTAHRPRKCLLQTTVAGIFPSLSLKMSTDSPTNLSTTHPVGLWTRPRTNGAEISFHLLLCRAAPLVSSSSDIFTSDHHHRDRTFAVQYRPIRECSICCPVK